MKCKALLVSCVFTLSACYSSIDSSSAPTIPTITYTEPVQLLGNIKGELKEEIPQLFSNSIPYTGLSNSAPIFVSADALGTMDDAMWKSVSSVFDNYHPVALVNPSEEQINLLLKNLGLDFHQSLQPGTAYAEIYALDREPNGHIFTYVMYPPATIAADASTDQASYVDNHDDQVVRTQKFLEWIALDNGRMTPALIANRQTAARAISLAATDGIAEDLLNIAHAFVQTIHSSNLGNNYQIHYYIYSAHLFGDSVESSSDWFYVREEGILNGKSTYSKGRTTPVCAVFQWCPPYEYIRGYAASYRMSSYVASDETDFYSPNERTDVELVATGPQGANNITTVTSSVGQHIGGTFGVKGVKPVATLDAGIDISNSASFNVSDVTVTNNSGSDVTNVSWTYDFLPPSQSNAFGFDNGLVYGKLNEGALLGHSTFEPVNQWIWKLSSDFRNTHTSPNFIASFEVSFGSTIGQKANQLDNLLGQSIDTYTGTYYQYLNQVPLVYPPLLVAPDDISFLTNASQTQQARVNVTGGWTAQCDNSWCKVDPLSGNGVSTIYVTVDENTTATSRTASIKFVSADGSLVEVTKVFQAP